MKLKNWHWYTVCAAGLVATAMGADSFISSLDGHYVVTGKVDQKISYRNLSQPYDMHVMTFNHDNDGYYPHINVGDTIVGPAGVMNKPVVESRRTKAAFPTACDVDVIETVNGKKLYELQQIAYRDSLLRIINQKKR